jgi:hypothetical protein
VNKLLSALCLASFPVVSFAAAPAAAPAPAKDATAKDQKKAEDPQQIAEKYLAALADPKKAQGKDYLLGGASLDAKAASVTGPKIVSKAEPRMEEGQVSDLKTAVDALDKAGLALLEEGAALGGTGGGEKKEVNLDHARKMAEKTKQLRKELVTKFPVFSDVIRVDKMIYWHPKNPARLLLQKSDPAGTYKVDYIAYTVESKDTAKDKARQWPLRLVKIKTDSVDTGWKVLPASEWDPE